MDIELHTWHGGDFDLCNDEVDHSKSIYKDFVPYLLSSYKKIEEHIESDQFLFGYLNKKESHSCYEREKEFYYHLKLSSSQVPLYINNSYWEKLYELEPIQFLHFHINKHQKPVQQYFYAQLCLKIL